MSRIAAPNGTNLIASREMSPRYAQRATAAISEAQRALALLANSEVADPQQVIAAVAHWRSAQAEISRWTDQLVGVAVMGGAPPTTAARALGMRASTLSHRLVKTWAAARGKQMRRDAGRGDGWTISASQ